MNLRSCRGEKGYKFIEINPSKFVVNVLVTASLVGKRRFQVTEFMWVEDKNNKNGIYWLDGHCGVQVEVSFRDKSSINVSYLVTFVLLNWHTSSKWLFCERVN